MFHESTTKDQRLKMYRKLYEQKCISGFMNTSDVLKVLKIAHAYIQQNYSFVLFVRVVSAPILQFLGLLFFHLPMFAKHSKRFV